MSERGSPRASYTAAFKLRVVGYAVVVNNVRQVLLYVNSNEKWTGMKNTGLKMPEKDQFYVRVGFSFY